MATECYPVSIKADGDYRRAIRALAMAQGVSVGVLIKQACDKAYGETLQPYIEFFSRTDRTEPQSTNKETR